MLSVVITAWNESENLPRVVSSVKGLADEIVVVDTESTDNTAVVAKKLGCKVYHHKKPGIVELVRNYSIDKAEGNWILLLDADEEVSSGLSELIKKTIAENKADYCRIPRKNIIFEKWITSTHWWPDYTYRLFKKGAISWQDTIHSIPITQGVGIDFPAQENLSLTHYNYSTISQYVDRLNRYTDFQSKDLFAAQTSFKWTDLISHPVQEFITHFFARRGYRDGLHGLALGLLQAFSQLVVYLKLWQLSGFPKAELSPTMLNKQLSSSQKQFRWWYFEYRIDHSAGLGQLIWKILRRLHL